MNCNYKTIEQIEIKNGVVYTKSYLPSASSTTVATNRELCEDVALTKILQKGGEHAVFREIGRSLFERRIMMRPHDCRLAEYLKQASDLLRAPLTLSLDSDTAGEFIATVTEGYCNSVLYSPFPELYKLEALRSDPEWVFSVCKNNPAAFHFSDASVRRNRNLARRYIHEFVLKEGFYFPTYFQNDKELALEALQMNASVFRFLDSSLRNDKDVVRVAFHPNTPRTEQDFFACYIGEKLRSDAAFMRKLVIRCPALLIDDCEEILYLPGVAEMWAAQNDWVQSELFNIPMSVVLKPTVQKVLAKRFSGDTFLLNVLDVLNDTVAQEVSREPVPTNICCCTANLPSRRIVKK